MKSTSMLLAVIVMAMTLLSGCVIVPLGGWHGHGHWRGGGGYYQHYGPPPYRGR